LLATSFALMSGATRLRELYQQVQQDMKNGKFDTLADLHASSSGMKAYSTWIASTEIDE